MRDFSEPGAVDWSAYAARYDMLLHHNPAYIDLLNRFDDWIDRFAPNGPIPAIDISAGTGSFAERLLQRRSDTEVTLVEPDEEMRAHAEAKLSPFGGRSRVLEGDFSTPFASDHNVVISTHAIYTAEDQRAALRSLAALASPGGAGFLIDFGRPMRVWSWRIICCVISSAIMGLTKHRVWRGMGGKSRSRTAASLKCRGQAGIGCMTSEPLWVR